jgi:alkylation response protein AidB-like acyl-CoA dehydrogenase
MNFDLTEDQLLVQRTARDFADQEIAPVARENDRTQNFPMDIMRKMATLGFLGGPLPQEYGGSGFDQIAFGLMVEEIGRVDSSMRSAMSVHVGLVGQTVTRWGGEDLKRRYLPKLCSGEMIGCFGLTEPGAGSDASAQATTAVREGDEWVLTGQKAWITNGLIADLAMIFAQTDRAKAHRGITCFLVETKTPGFAARNIEGKFGVRASATSELFLDHVRVPHANILGELDQGFEIAMDALNNGRYTVAAGATGTAQACLDASVAYAASRETFGKKIAAHQAVAAMIADMVVEIEAARLLWMKVGHLKNKGLQPTKEVSMAKLFCSEVAVKAAYNAMQIHGANGYSDEFPVERYYRDARVTTIYEGTSEMQRLIISSLHTGIRSIA